MKKIGKMLGILLLFLVIFAVLTVGLYFLMDRMLTSVSDSNAETATETEITQAYAGSDGLTWFDLPDESPWGAAL